MKDLDVGIAAALEKAASEHKMVKDPYDGCLAALTVAYQFAETVFIFPITPTTPLGEGADQWAAAGKVNAFGVVPKVQQMQSEGGAAASVHGSLVVGALSTTFTASQGLLLMIPNLYKIAGELLPCVIHVAARSLAGQALSIFGDHSDIMAVRQTGVALLSSHSVQESLDLALASHIATHLCSVPFIHFFDGFRTSHEISKIEALTEEHMKVVVELLADDIDAFRRKALNPNHPSLRGTAQSGDIYFQNLEAANKFHMAVPDAVRTAMQWVEKLTGRSYDLFEYYGNQEATDIVVVMGSGATVLEELIDHYGPEKKVGMVKIHLFRPWSARHFLACVPSTVRRIAVLDRCKETGLGEPLFMDVCATLQACQMGNNIRVIGGRYGLASKDFTTGQAHAVFENLAKEDPQHPFTVGIKDDVTHLSLDYTELDTVAEGTMQSLLFGFGSDGTVGANKNAIKLIAKQTDLYAQGYFAYDALKAGGITCSNLRFGPKPIKGSYEIMTGCAYVAIHKKEYLRAFPVDIMLGALQDGGIFVLNSPWTDAESLRENMPLAFRQRIVQGGFKFYNIDAGEVARRAGMGRLINNIMQTVFWHLSKVMDASTAISLFKKEMEKTYRAKGPEVVRKNLDAVDMALDYLKIIEVDAQWSAPLPGEVAKPIRARDGSEPQHVTQILDKIHLRQGDQLTVSDFEPGGQVPLGHTQWAKRGVAPSIPVVDMDKCTQCNKCSAICPHAVIRPFLASQSEMKAAPLSFKSKRAQGGHAMTGLEFRIQASPLDCTGCQVCVTSCPDEALKMVKLDDAVAEGHVDNWNFAMSLKSRSHRMDKFSVKGSQFNQPLLEFSGACEGCGETPYAKLLTQLFGKRMIVANATGCSSIWGATAGWIAYTKDKETGKGPAWGNSLFEDNAEYGVGMLMGVAQRRRHVTAAVEKALEAGETKGNPALHAALREWLDRKEDGDLSAKLSDEIAQLLDEQIQESSVLPTNLRDVSRLRDVLVRPSMWMMGGDGWANDIGFGGIDHAVALGENINICVLDTEVYSNTGGQSSKATPLGSVAKFAQKGRRLQKKDLGGALMNYQGVYVASVAMGANYQQCVKAFQEAEAHPGPSIVMCYSPCIEHRTKTGLTLMAQDQKAAVDCGYWPLYRFDPKRADDGQPVFQLDSKTLTGNVVDFLRNQNRYSQLERALPEDAKRLQCELEEHLAKRHAAMKSRSEELPAGAAVAKLVEGLQGPEILVLYASETGTAEIVARRFARSAKERGCTIKKMTELNDCCDLDAIEATTIVAFVATCGDGEVPANGELFHKKLKDLEGKCDKHRFLVFALGDKGYPKFCAAGKVVAAGLATAGAKELMEMGVGDQCDEDGWETGYGDWMPTAMEKIGALPPPKRNGPAPAQVSVKTFDEDLGPKQICPPGAVLAPVIENRRLPPPDYERDVRHFVLDTSSVDLPYHLGDAIALYPENLDKHVEQALAHLGLDADKAVRVDPAADDVPPRLLEVCKSRTTARQLFKEVLDICGRPSRNFYAQLAEFASADDKEELLSISTTEKFSAMLDESTSILDVLLKFPSAKPSLAHLMTIVPLIKPRLYSIANSPDYAPGRVELTVVVNRWMTKSGNVKTGTSTQYISELQVGQRIAATMTTGTFVFPEDDRVPMVMTGLGTGIAPMRAFVQDRMYKKQQGKEVGPMVVFYGCRHEREEYFYRDEWEAFKKAGVLTNMVPAFSHDPPHYPPKMVFVNHKMEEEMDLLKEFIGKQNGYFYMCGLAVAAPGIETALKKAMVGAGYVKATEADEWVEEMKRTGRYSMESY